MIVRFRYDVQVGVFHADYYQDNEGDYASGPFLRQENGDYIQFLKLVIGILNVRREPAQDFYGEDFPKDEREALDRIFVVYNRHVPEKGLSPTVLAEADMGS